MSFNGGRSCIDSPEWIKNKKYNNNSNNSDDKCSQYTVNHKNIRKHQERISKISRL